MAREKTYRSRKHRAKSDSPSPARKTRKKTSKRPYVLEPRPVEKRSKPAPIRETLRKPTISTLDEGEFSKHEDPTRIRNLMSATDALVAEKARNVKKTVSAAGMFKKGKEDVKKMRKHKIFSPEKAVESDLSVDFHEYLEEARQAIDSNMLKSFGDAHEELTVRLAASRRSDEEFFEQLCDAATALAFPLAEEQISSTFKRDGEQVTETVNMGQRIADFKNNIERDKMRLEDQWKQWEELQNEYIELGLDVFGPEAFDDMNEHEEQRGIGYRWEMELVNLEHSERVEEITAEIESLKPEALKKMVKTEKEMIASSNEETARIVRAIIGD